MPFTKSRFAHTDLLRVAPLALALVAACLQPAGPAYSAVAAAEVKLLLQTGPDARGQDADAIVRQVAEGAGLDKAGVDYGAPSGGGWHAVTLRCADAARCHDAVARLKADTRHFKAVEFDAPKAAVPRSKSQ